MQSKLYSHIESLTNIATGIVINLVAIQIIFPLFGYPITVEHNIMMAIPFTFISWGRSYTLRRLFNKIRR